MSKKSSGRKRAEKVRKRHIKQEQKDERRALTFETMTVSEARSAIDEPPGLPFDRRLMEREMSRFFGAQAAVGTTAALQTAQELIFEAWEARTPALAAKLANQALNVCPDCADAYVVLAELAESVSEALPLYEQGVAAGRRALAAEWDDIQESFWSYLPSRPFLRAMRGQADCLWGVGRRDASIETYLEMLKLNPNDNQGIRDVVMPLLLEKGRDAACRKLLDQYPERSCFSKFNSALWEFRRSGDSQAAREALRTAAETNSHLIAELLASRPSSQPVDSYSRGSPEEARVYMDLGARAWRTTPGALAWLRRMSLELPEPPRQQLSKRERKAEQAELYKAVRKLPLSEDDVWELHLVPADPGDPDMPDDIDDTSMALHVYSKTDGLPLAMDIFDDEPLTTDDLWESVMQCFLKPRNGPPRRPSRCEFLDEEFFSQLEKPLSKLGIRSELAVDADERMAEIQSSQEARRQQATFRGDLRDLPVADEEAWLIGTRQLDLWLPNEAGESCRPWVWLAMSPQDGMVIHSNLSTEPPSAEAWCANLEAAMRRPMIGEARRPTLVVVRVADHRLMLEELVSRGVMECVVHDDFEPWDAVAEMMASTFAQRRPCTPYVEVPELSRDQLASFFGAAAEFFRQAPWQFTPSDSVWKVELAHGGSSPWWAVVIGQNGETFGLALYDDLNCLVDMMSGALAGPQVVGRVSAICINYEEAQLLAGADLDAIEQFGWPIPTPEAYPLVYRAKRERELETPSAGEFLWLEAVLRTLPTFIRSGQQTQNLTAQQAAGQCDLSWSRIPPNALRS